MAFDSLGNLYVVGINSTRVRKIDTQGNVTTIGKNSLSDPEYIRIAVTLSDAIYILDGGHQRLFKLETSGNITLIDDNNYGFNGVAHDGSSSILLLNRSEIYKLVSSGKFLKIAGTGKEGFTDGPAQQAQFHQPSDLVVDKNGDIYISDTGNNRIRKLILP
jgi:sugar lactone lactonase YvrE